MAGRPVTPDTLGVLAGHHIAVSASGRQAREALAAISALVRRNFDEAVATSSTYKPEVATRPLGVSPGIGIGPKTTFEFPVSVRSRAMVVSDERSPRQRLQGALDAARTDLISIRDRVAREYKDSFKEHRAGGVSFMEYKVPAEDVSGMPEALF